MIIIDGAYGEGGGQILRTALSLSAITGQALQVRNIRANRSKPGLRPQHLTAARATAALCNARVQGAHLESQMLTFHPQISPQPGNYTFDVSESAPHGSAGSVTLILQTVLLPLALASGASQVTLRGGTHVPMSPPALYIEKVYLPILFKLGIKARLQHRIWGFVPQGKGELLIEISGQATLRPGAFMTRGALQSVEGVAFVAKLPSHIPQRMSDRARAVLRQVGFPRVQIDPRHVSSPGTGAGMFLLAHYEHSRAGFDTLGRRGWPSEKVAEHACRALLDYHRTGAAVDPHLADQLLLPCALAGGISRLTVSAVTQHLLTNAWVIEQFGLASVDIKGDSGEAGHVTIQATP